MSILKATVQCPHCSKVSKYETAFSDTPNRHGEIPHQCQKCHQLFWIQVRHGQVTGTHK